MKRMDPRWLLIGWGVFALAFDFMAVYGVYTAQAGKMILLLAGAVSFLFIYLLVIYHVDGITFKNTLVDERLSTVSAKAQQNSFWFLFLSIWALAILLNVHRLAPLLHMDILLPLLGAGGILIQMLSFLWYKYHV
ncbi:MAG: hypothetical protein ACM3MK_06695 [Chitinophagales bacterium]